jgi:hypothetical protein
VVDQLFERTGDQHAADGRVAGGNAGHLVEHGESASDPGARRAIAFYGPGEVLAEAAVQKVIIVADVETCFGKEIGKILFQVLIDVVEPRTFRHCSLVTPEAGGRYLGARTLGHNDARCNRYRCVL